MPGNWTATPPTVPGWYWWRSGPQQKRCALCVENWKGYWVVTSYAVRRPLVSWGGEWWSEPIQEPPA